MAINLNDATNGLVLVFQPFVVAFDFFFDGGRFGKKSTEKAFGVSFYNLIVIEICRNDSVFFVAYSFRNYKQQIFGGDVLKFCFRAEVVNYEQVAF